MFVGEDGLGEQVKERLLARLDLLLASESYPGGRYHLGRELFHVGVKFDPHLVEGINLTGIFDFLY